MSLNHLLGRQGHFNATILVKLVSRKKRCELMMKKKSLMYKEEYDSVFIGDDLTPLRSRLLVAMEGRFMPRHVYQALSCVISLDGLYHTCMIELYV
jgi:hypothetical protein